MRLAKNRLTIAIVAVAVGLVGFGLLGFAARQQATHNPDVAIPTRTVTETTDTPDETPLNNKCDAYAVPADQPRKIELPTLGVSGCVVKVGADQYGAIATPPNIFLAGWYVQSPVPGGKGISVIDGHAGGRYADGIFKSLPRLNAGDDIKVQFGDGSWRIFGVQELAQYDPQDSVAAAMAPLPGVAAQLSLITCDGQYDEKKQTYDKRFVVKTALRQ